MLLTIGLLSADRMTRTSSFTLCAALLLTPVAAYAFDTRVLGQIGTVDLAHVRGWKDTPRLRSEVEAQLRKAGKSAEEVNCLSWRFPGAWIKLGGDRAPPYVCHFGDKDLHMRWTVTLVDARGRRFDRASAAAKREASDLLLTHPVWRWAAPDANAEP
jgi:hypothetical protein